MNPLEPKYLLDLLQVTEEDRINLLNSKKPKIQLELAFKYIHGIVDNDISDSANEVESSQGLRKACKFINFAMITRAMPNLFELSPMEKELKDMQDSMIFSRTHNVLNRLLLSRTTNKPLVHVSDVSVEEILCKRGRHDLADILRNCTNPSNQLLILLTTAKLDTYIQMNMPQDELELLAGTLINTCNIDEEFLCTNYVWAFLKVLKGESLL